MEIKCRKSNRFLMDIDIESYLKQLEDIGIVQEMPIKVTIPCKSCKQVEVYYIYKNKYVFIENLTRNSK